MLYIHGCKQLQVQKNLKCVYYVTIQITSRYWVFVTCCLENNMDGESLVTLIRSKPGPDCLKDVVQKVGPRMKLYKAIQTLYSNDTVRALILKCQLNAYVLYTL